jgi:hypothetical protein
MSVSSANAPAAAASKTRYIETLLSGTSWTVPAGVTYVNATLVGAGGGGGQGGGVPRPEAKGGQVITTSVTTTPGASIAYAIGAGGAANSYGGDTTFTGAATAYGGAGGADGNTYISGRDGRNGIVTNNYGTTVGNGGGNSNSGGSGSVILEYWK